MHVLRIDSLNTSQSPCHDMQRCFTLWCIEVSDISVRYQLL